ncbi:hypothetical protein Pcinc_018091 [Petrolisthes cinctipes]|uniref:Uncharacterized protein n=1 Tax=Petrolisthes cinctipes TaxID=88211 RepID=A0AAE1FNQ7_PETCI|nr:hypothetical protein Pcinc_018091 [Petrolisthes cinctipes]
MLTLWRALVQPVLDYCSQLWSPHMVLDIQALESVQREYTRQVKAMKELSYWERLKRLGLYSQQRRRERYIITYTWKALEKLVPSPSNINEVEPQFNQRTGRKCVRKYHHHKHQRGSRLSYHPVCPTMAQESSTAYQDLTDCSVDSFKTQLDSVLRTVPDELPVPGYTSLCRAVTNSLPDQVDLQRRDTGLGRSVGTPLL